MKESESEALILTHDLRNNTGAAITYLQLLVMGDPSLESNANIIAAIENLNHSMKLSNDISMKIENQNENTKSESKLVTIACNKHFFEKAKPAYDKLRKMYPIKINDTYSLIDSEKHIEANQTAIASLRENIINNAINSGATEIDVSLEMKEYCLVITYKDNGSGMAQEDIDKIYLKKHGDGVAHGLGTKSIMNTINEGDGAYIQYSSEINDGTQIRIIVPYVTQ